MDDLRGPEIAALLQEHLDSVSILSPPESTHALSLDDLRVPELTLWSAWQGPELVGCAGLRERTSDHGEIKSMRTSSSHLRQGVARALLEHLLWVARDRGYQRLSLETGSMDDFIPARRLYESCGFKTCGPFSNYVDDANSVFMTRGLGPAPAVSTDGYRT